MRNKAFRLGCDIGGTFADFVLVNDETGKFLLYMNVEKITLLFLIAVFILAEIYRTRRSVRGVY
ncbi:MAG: hypothetical protein ACYDHG_14990 [Desulfomonilaceae bacterium]